VEEGMTVQQDRHSRAMKVEAAHGQHG